MSKLGALSTAPNTTCRTATELQAAGVHRPGVAVSINRQTKKAFGTYGCHRTCPSEFKFNDEGAVLHRPRGIFGASDAAASDAAALVDDNDGAVLDGDPPMLLDRDDAAADAAVPPYRKCGSHRADELTAGPKGLCSDKCEMIPSQSTTHSLVDEPLRYFRTS